LCGLKKMEKVGGCKLVKNWGLMNIHQL